MILVAVMPTIVLVFAMMPIVGAASVAMISLSNATLQLNSDPKLRGRVMSLFSMALIGSSPIGGPIVGWIGEHSSARVSLLIGGIAAVGAAAVRLDDHSATGDRRHPKRQSSSTLASRSLVAA